MGVGVIVIRDFRPSDIAAAAALEAQHQPQPWTEGIFRDELEAPGRIYLVAEEVHLVGFGGVMVVGDEAHITNLLVAATERGRGVGRRVLVTLIEKAIGAGARHLTLEVRSRNEVARRLYSSVGLAPVGVRPNYYGDDDALILWAHDIDQPAFMEGLR